MQKQPDREHRSGNLPSRERRWSNHGSKFRQRTLIGRGAV